MNNVQKTITIITGIFIVGLLLHFIPIRQDSGLVEKSSTTCEWRSVTANHRLINGGYSSYNDQLKLFVSGEDKPCGTYNLNLKLFVL